ncbi:MAG: phosphoribosylpyrophosphate synthetase [Bryobacterales bacterium]|nr:phosphoribosylpyrophosphate synthetase [Bryobacterales bacterium]
MPSNSFTILAGTANPPLAAAIARELGVALGACAVGRFPDGEVMVQLHDPVRRKDVFLVQPTSSPVNDHLMELLAMADACRRAAAASITAIVPYFGYGRADKRHGRREPITGRVVADLLQVVGISHVVTVDLHTPQIEGFFHAPVDSLTAVPILCEALSDRVSPDWLIVSTDVGRVQMAACYAQCLGLPVVILRKRRNSASQTEVTHIVGDVSNRSCLLVDDIVSTGGTLAESITALLKAGARPDIIIAVTHGLLLPGAREKLDHPAVREVFVTDSVGVPREGWPALHVVSIAPLIAGALERLLETRGDARHKTTSPS